MILGSTSSDACSRPFIIICITVGIVEKYEVLGVYFYLKTFLLEFVYTSIMIRFTGSFGASIIHWIIFGCRWFLDCNLLSQNLCKGKSKVLIIFFVSNGRFYCA